MTDHEPSPKRRRPAVACTSCAARKIKCDRSLPCNQCLRADRPCIYSQAAFDKNIETVWRLPTTSSIEHPAITVDTNLQPDPAVNGTFSDSGCLDLSSLLPNHTLDPALLAPNSLQLEVKQVKPFSSSVGKGHWRRFIDKIDVVASVSKEIRTFTAQETKGRAATIWHSCQTRIDSISAKIAKVRRMQAMFVPQPESLPPRHVCDKLLQLYSDTFESVYGIFYGSPFFDDYCRFWNGDDDLDSRFLQKLLLVLAIGMCFSHDEGQDTILTNRLQASGWIAYAMMGLARSSETDETDIETLRISCLLHIARQTDIVSSELAWISADLPLRVALALEMHKDPAIHFLRMDTFEVSMRRHLWAVVLELSLQMSLDSGMLPAINNEAFDTAPPTSSSEAATTIQASAPNQTPITRTSSQAREVKIKVLHLLSQTLRTRLRITHLINSLSPLPRYHTVLKLSTELDKTSRAQLSMNEHLLTPFQKKTLIVINQRFLLELHRSFAQQARTDPTFFYSRKVVADASVAILRCATDSPTAINIAGISDKDDFTTLFLRGSGLVKHNHWHAAAALASEVHHDLNTRALPLNDHDSTKLICVNLRSFTRLLVCRIQHGDTEVMPMLVFSSLHRILCSSNNGGAIEPQSLTEADVVSALEACERSLEQLAEKFEDCDGNMLT